MVHLNIELGFLDKYALPDPGHFDLRAIPQVELLLIFLASITTDSVLFCLLALKNIIFLYSVLNHEVA
jgi:hypothetical protein